MCAAVHKGVVSVAAESYSSHLSIASVNARSLFQLVKVFVSQ